VATPSGRQRSENPSGSLQIAQRPWLLPSDELGREMVDTSVAVGPPGHSGSRGARSFGVGLGVRLALGIGLLTVWWVAVSDRLRSFEARSVLAVGSRLDESFVRLVGSDGVMVVPGTHEPFVARITASCSAATSLGIVIVLAAVLVPAHKVSSFPRVLAALLIVFVANFARITMLLVVGSYFGRGAMRIAHDWGGTIITLLAAALGVAIILGLPFRGRRKQPPEVLR
jgi:exosortase/archaeosortase family protein